MEPSVTSKVAIVTGANQGIGAAVAARLSSAGYRLVLNDVKAQDTALGCNIRNTEMVIGDVADPTTAEALVDRALSAFGRCDLLVNNAGYLEQAPFGQISIDDWDRMIGVHLRGTFLCCRAVLPVMVASGRGVVINMASQLGQKGGIDLAHYVAAKAGVIGLTRALAHEFSSKGIRINAVAPGPIETPLVQKASEAWRRKKLNDLPLGRFGEAVEVAETVAFLASDAAALYVGQTLGPNSGDVML